MMNSYFVELWKLYTEKELVRRYGPMTKSKAEKLEDALDLRIDHEFYECYVVSQDDVHNEN